MFRHRGRRIIRKLNQTLIFFGRQQLSARKESIPRAHRHCKFRNGIDDDRTPPRSDLDFKGYLPSMRNVRGRARKIVHGNAPQ